MFRFILGRLAVLIPTFLGVSLIAFSFIRLLPGDPVMLMSGERVMSEERHAAIMHDLGLDRPMYVQYLDYLTAQPSSAGPATTAIRTTSSTRCSAAKLSAATTARSGATRNSTRS